MRYELYVCPKMPNAFFSDYVLSSDDLICVLNYTENNSIAADEKYVIVDTYPTGKINYNQLGLCPRADYKEVKELIYVCKKAKIVSEYGVDLDRYLAEMAEAEQKAEAETLEYFKGASFLSLSDLRLDGIQ